MVLLIAIAAVGVIAIGIGTAIQSAQAQNTCGGGFHGDPDDTGHGQSFHDCKGDAHNNGHA